MQKKKEYNTIGHHRGIMPHAGLYYQLLKRYYDLFNSDQIHIFLYEDYVQDPIRTLKCIYELLDVDSDFFTRSF